MLIGVRLFMVDSGIMPGIAPGITLPGGVRPVAPKADAAADPNVAAEAGAAVDPKAAPKAGAAADPRATPEAGAAVDPKAAVVAEAVTDPQAAEAGAEPSGAEKGMPTPGGGWLKDVGKIGRPEVNGHPVTLCVVAYGRGCMGRPDDGTWRLLKTEISWLSCLSIRSMRSSVSDEAAAGAAAAVVAGAELAAVVAGCVTPGAAVVIAGAAVVIAGAAVVTVGGSPSVDMMIQFEGFG